MQELFLPTVHTFENDNIFTGSYGALRFKITPTIVKKTPKEVDLEQSTMRAEAWHGELCYEKSEIEASAVFPISAEGREALLRWLMEQT